MSDTLQTVRAPKVCAGTVDLTCTVGAVGSGHGTLACVWAAGAQRGAR